MNFVDLWGWFNTFRAEARQTGDADRMRLGQLYDRAQASRQNDPETALTLLAEGSALAERLHEPWIMLFLDYWRCDCYLYITHDYKRALDLAMRNSVEVQKPVYESCPVRGLIYLTLAEVYRTIDGPGYAKQITEILNYLEKEVPVDKDTWLRMGSTRALLAENLGNMAEAERLTLSYMARCDGDNFRLAFAYRQLCDFGYRKRRFQSALEYARLGEEAARLSNQPRASMLCLAWQALLQRKLGNELEAQSLYQVVTTNAQWFAAHQGGDYYYVLCEYHEAKADYAAALKVRQEQLTHALDSGSPSVEAWAYYNVCRLLVKTRQPLYPQLTLAIAAAHKLKDPKPLLKRLDALELQTVGGCRLLLWFSRWTRNLRAQRNTIDS